MKAKIAKNIPVSVVIVTKNRSSCLMECLSSLITQSVHLDELVIVDNDSIDDTLSTIKNFKKNVRFPVKVVSEKKSGYAEIYNTGIRSARFPWIAFIDDDCVADRKWFESIKNTVRQRPQAAAFLGKTRTYYEKNAYAQAFSLMENLWKESRVERNKVIDFDILDNKNIVYSKKFLEESKIKFDEKRKNAKYGAEDSDLGLEIQKWGGVALYVPGSKVQHKDPDNFQYFFKKVAAYTLSRHFLFQKWTSVKNTKKSFIWKTRYLFAYKKEENLGSLFFLQIIALFFLGNILKKYLAKTHQVRLVS